MAQPDETPADATARSALYVSDLDGTLLRNDAYLSDSSKEALERLVDDGLVFSVASARSVVSMQPLLKDLQLKLPVIEFNGAFLSDLRSGRHEVVNALDPRAAHELYATISSFSAFPFVSTFDGTADRVYHREPANDGERSYIANRRAHNDPRLRLAEDPSGALVEQVVCMTVIDELAPLRDLEAAIGESFGAFVEMHLFENRYSPGWYWLTVHDRRATKDQAIRLMMDIYGLEDHELVVFGDHINDIKMFQLAAHAIAVADAHPEAKRHATRVIGSNDEDSVVEFIDRHFNDRRAAALTGQ